MENFLALGLPQPLLQALQKMNFSQPTPIQAAAIPPALAGRDILGSAQTGTGKTAAFGVPLLAHLIENPNSTALIMTPTRELAAQVLKALQLMMSHTPQIKSALLIGGESMYKQLQQLRARPRLIVGTPGRINDHLQQTSLNLSATDFLVLDETDKMLDMGFEVQIDRIVKKIPQKRQTLMFSATLPPFIVKLAEKYQRNPERVAVAAAHLVAPKIKQELVQVQQSEKFTALMTQLAARTGSVIIFVKTKRGADRLAKKLNAEKHSADAIHGDLNQNKRNRVIDAFRNKKYRILVATDVAARGLDIPHIEHVINHDLPQVAEDYIHRIGRTARAGAEGAAVCFITPDDREKWHEIHLLMHPSEKGSAASAPSSRPPQKKAFGGSRGKGYKPSGRPAGKPADTRGSDKPKSRYAGKPSGTSSGKPAGHTAAKPAGRAGSKPPYKSKNTSGGGYARRRSAA